MFSETTASDIIDRFSKAAFQGVGLKMLAEQCPPDESFPWA